MQFPNDSRIFMSCFIIDELILVRVDVDGVIYAEFAIDVDPTDDGFAIPYFAAIPDLLGTPLEPHTSEDGLFMFISARPRDTAFERMLNRISMTLTPTGLG
jgi:hypothetical protein